MKEAYEEVLGDWSSLSEYEMKVILFAVLERLNLDAVRTNKTQYSDEQIFIKSAEVLK